MELMRLFFCLSLDDYYCYISIDPLAEENDNNGWRFCVHGPDCMFESMDTDFLHCFLVILSDLHLISFILNFSWTKIISNIIQNWSM